MGRASGKLENFKSICTQTRPATRVGQVEQSWARVLYAVYLEEQILKVEG